MKHQEIISRVAALSGMSEHEMSDLIRVLPLSLADLLKSGGDMAVPGFGTFEVHKRLERVVENPATGRRTLTPPRLLLRYHHALPDRPAHTLHELAQALTRRTKTDVQQTLQFAAQCFGTLHEGLLADGFASLKGIGTFHTNQETPETEGQTLFTPDDSLAALINRPFAELPEVELDPATTPAELEAVNAEFPTASPSAPDTGEHENAESEPTETDTAEGDTETTDLAANDVVTDDTAPAAHTETEPTTEPTAESEVPSEPDTADAEPAISESVLPASEDAEHHSDIHWRRTAVVLATVCLALLLFIVLRMGRTEAPALEPPDTASTALQTIATDSLAPDTLPATTERTQIIHLNDPSEVFTDFEPDGVLCEHTVEFGDMLIRLAEHYYGNPYFVKILIEYNGLPASGDAKPGTVLKIPHLRRKAGK